MSRKSRSHSPKPALVRRKHTVVPKTVKRDPWTRKDGEVHGKELALGYARVSTLD